MLKKLVALLFLSFVIFRGMLANPQEDLQMANAAYQSGDFSKAIAGYEALVDEGWQSADLYYNLGTSYLQSKELGRAVLYLERALLRAPGDSDIQYNLRLAEAQLKDEINPVPQFFLSRWWRSMAIAISANVWSIIGLLLVWLGVGGLVLWLLGWQRSWRKWGFLGGLPVLLIGLIPLFLAFSRVHLEVESDMAILQEKEMPLYTAPDEASAELFKLHEGTKVQIIDQIGEWYKIRLLNGDQGWLLVQFAERI